MVAYTVAICEGAIWLELRIPLGKKTGQDFFFVSDSRNRFASRTVSDLFDLA